MNIQAKTILAKDGQQVIIRSVEKKDAKAVLAYLRKVSGETPFLARDAEDVLDDIEQEESMLQSKEKEPGEAMLVAEVKGAIVGACSISGISDLARYAHRCSMGIAVEQAYCGLGIGKRMMEEILNTARECGYEQIELSVVSQNTKAYHLYQSLGFETYGTQKHSMKYKDGTYADEYLMYKML